MVAKVIVTIVQVQILAVFHVGMVNILRVAAVYIAVELIIMVIVTIISVKDAIVNAIDVTVHKDINVLRNLKSGYCVYDCGNYYY